MFSPVPLEISNAYSNGHDVIGTESLFKSRGLRKFSLLSALKFMEKFVDDIVQGTYLENIYNCACTLEVYLC